MLLSAAALALAATPAFAAVTANPTLTGTTVSTIPAITLTSDLAAGTAIDWEITGPSPGNAFSINGSGPWPVTTLPAQAPGDDGLYTLSATDVGGAQTAIATFTVDRTPPGAPGTPTITGTNPTPLATPTFSWTAVQDPGDSFEWQVLVNGTVTQTSTTTATSVTAAALGTGTYSFQVRQRDALLNTGSFSPALAFTVDLAAPTGGVIAHVPVANQVAGFTRTANVSINLTTASVDNLAGTLTYALTATSTPAPSAAAFAAWTAARPFTVTATQGAATTVFLWARDAAGNISPAPVASTPITFDNQGPTVLGTSFPLPGVNLTTAFGTLANVRINFNEPVQNPVPLIRMCVNPCGLPIAAAVTYGEITGPIALLDPAATLAIGTTYEIELPAVRDRAGNLLTGPGSSQWTFTTSSDGTPTRAGRRPGGRPGGRPGRTQLEAPDGRRPRTDHRPAQHDPADLPRGWHRRAILAPRERDLVHRRRPRARRDLLLRRLRRGCRRQPLGARTHQRRPEGAIGGRGNRRSSEASQGDLRPSS